VRYGSPCAQPRPSWALLNKFSAPALPHHDPCCRKAHASTRASNRRTPAAGAPARGALVQPRASIPQKVTLPPFLISSPHFLFAGLCFLLSSDAFSPSAMPMGLQRRARLATSSARPAASVGLRMSAGSQVNCARGRALLVFAALHAQCLPPATLHGAPQPFCDFHKQRWPWKFLPCHCTNLAGEISSPRP
jgi:hypothetical protein